MFGLKSIYKNYLVFLAALTAIYVFFLSGYSFYVSDHTTQIPTVLHFLDNQLYQKDYEAQILNPFIVKFLPHFILFIISRITHIPTSIVYFISYFAITYAILFFTYKITYKLSQNHYPSLLACLMLVLFSNQPLFMSSTFKTLNDLLVPYYIAVPLHLLCLYVVLKNRFLLSVFICGALFYIHGQIGIFTILAILVTHGFIHKKPLAILKYLALYVLIILPALPTLFHLNHPGQPLGKYTVNELCTLRSKFDTFSDPGHLLIFGIIIVLIVLALKLDKHKNDLKNTFLYWNYSLIIIYLAGILFSRFIPLDAMLLMKCLRVDALLRISFLVLIAIKIFDTSRLINSTSKGARKAYLLAVPFFLVFIFLLFPHKFTLPRITISKNNFVSMSLYIKLNTPKNSLFITPPNIEGFRLYAERSNVIDFKTHPIGRGVKLQDEWMDRLLNVCNIKEFESTGFDTYKQCGRGFQSLARNDFLFLCNKYKADYFVSYYNPRKPDTYQDILIYKNSNFILCPCPKNDPSM